MSLSVHPWVREGFPVLSADQTADQTPDHRAAPAPERGPRPNVQEDAYAGWIAVGQVMGAFGPRGEVRVKPLSRFPHRFRELRRVFVGEHHRPAAVLRRLFRTRDVILGLDIATTRDEARALLGSHLYLPETEAVQLPAGEYFVHQIVGLTAMTAAGEALGTVAEVLQTGSNDVYVVRGPRGEVLLPATKEVVKQVNLDQGIMVVQPLPGLID